MYVTDWNAWCEKHHIKLKGSDEQHVNRKNAGAGHQRISRTVLEKESAVYGRPPGNCDLQNHDRRETPGQVSQDEEKRS